MNRFCANLAIACFLLLATALPSAAQNPFLSQRQERTVAAIHFSGNDTTQEYVLERTFGVAAGDPYSPVAISDGWERLERLPFLAWVDIEESRLADGNVELSVVVVEESRFGVLPYVHYERRHDGYILGTSAHLQNLRGRAEELRLTTAWLAFHGYHLGWHNPHILDDARLRISVDLDWQRYDFRFRPFRLRDSSVRFGVGRDFQYGLGADIDYTLRELRADESSGRALSGETRDDALQLTIHHDSRDQRFYPTQGVFAEARMRFAGLNETPYQLYTAHVAAFVTAPFVDIIAGRFEYRFAGQALPVYERSFLGGPSNLRGIEFGSVEGDDHILATLEVRRPVFILALTEGRSIGLGVHAFHDWGTAIEYGDDLSQGAMRRSFGAGIHFNFNRKNIRVEWAQDDSGENSLVFEDSFTF